MNTLHAELLEAHRKGDGAAMIGLYAQAADASDDADEEMFFLTHAYIFALEAGDARAEGIRERLRAAGRI
ncbi:MAG: hypothetical protein AAFP28_02945 [Pseudomonadota bacterium]